VPPRWHWRASATRETDGRAESLRSTYNIRDERIRPNLRKISERLADSNAPASTSAAEDGRLSGNSEQTRQFYARKFKYITIDEPRTRTVRNTC
jgi:hypothetical protein